MNIEDVRAYALSHKGCTEDVFAEDWLSFRVEGKWFLLVWLCAPEPTVAVKLNPEVGVDYRCRYDGVKPAYHMNKAHWNDLCLNRLSDDFVKNCIDESYRIVVEKLPLRVRKDYMKRN